MKTIREAANMFGLSEIGIWKLLRQGRIKGTANSRGGRVLIDIHELERILEESPALSEELSRKHSQRAN